MLARLPAEDLFVLNDAYKAQDDLTAIHRGFYPVLAQIPGEFRRGGDVTTPLLTLRLYISDVVGGENMILQRYDAALARLEGGA